LVAILHSIILWQESRNITGGAGSSLTGADQCAARKYHETWAAVSDCGLLYGIKPKGTGGRIILSGTDILARN